MTKASNEDSERLCQRPGLTDASPVSEMETSLSRLLFLHSLILTYFSSSIRMSYSERYMT